MKIWNQIAQYLYLKKKDPNEKTDTNIKLMHGMNRISIIVFLLALLIMLFRAIFKH